MSIEQFNTNPEHLAFINIEQFTEGKNPPKNEDLMGYNENTIVLSDGATDKSGQDFEGRTGGELAAEVVVKVSLGSEKTGEALVTDITTALNSLYEKINPNALNDSAYRFAATLVVAKLVNDQLIITQVGDSSFRINGKETYTNNKIVDALTATTRKHYIELTGDVAGSRDYIMPLLKVQHIYQNNADSPLGYGVIDGSPVPPKFIQTFTFNKDDVTTLELVSDGYYGVFPEATTVDAYEALHKHIEETDPNKCGEFASTKLSDDRTIVIAHLN